MHHYSHTSHPCARLFQPHIQAAFPLTRIICRCFYLRCSVRTLLLPFSLVLCCVLLTPPPPFFLPVFALETHAEEYSLVSAEARVFIILTLRRFHIMKNYQPPDSCPDVCSFQLCRGNQAHLREKRGERTASTRVRKRMAKCSLLKNLFSLLSAGVNAVKSISAEQME